MIVRFAWLWMWMGTIVAQDPDIVTVRVDSRVTPENRIVLIADATIRPPYHIYGVVPVEGPIATEIAWELPAGLEVDGSLVAPAGEKHFDQGFEKEVVWYSGTPRFEQAIRVISASGDVPIRVRVRYQACTETYCLPPTTVSAEYVLTIPSGMAAQGRSTQDTALDSRTVNERIQSYQVLRKESMLSFIGLAFLTGLIALLTPCVFPMIPITVSFFTKHAAPTRPQAIQKALIYVGGIISSFALFGWLMSLILGASGAQNFAANPWVNLAIAALFVLFALSLFGVFEIRLPNFLIRLTQTQSASHSNLGILFAGITFTLVSFTCTVQFVGILMVASASGEWFLPILGMLCFAAAFSAPFFFLALFPQYLASMPKSGGWLHETKIVMAFIEIAAAFKFLSNVDLVWDMQWLTRPALLSIWIVLSAMCGWYLLGKIRFQEDEALEKVGVGRGALSFWFLSTAVYLASGLFGQPLQADLDAYLPPVEYGAVRAAGTSHEKWIEDYATAVTQSRQTGKPIFVDFTGKTCTNCRLMEKTIFTRPDVQEIFDQMVLARLWTDFGDQQEEYQALQQRLVGSVALPFYVILDDEENVLASFGGLERDPELFKSFLRKGLQNNTEP